MIVIEMNPRVSRSSALASKATGFPIAKAAARLAVGYTLDEITNDITKATPACFEPSIDYVRRQGAAFRVRSSGAPTTTLSTLMKAVGEAMAIGRHVRGGLRQGHALLENGRAGLNCDDDLPMPSIDRTAPWIRCDARPRSHLLLRQARRGWGVDRVSEVTRIDPWFIARMRRHGGSSGGLRGMRLDELDRDAFPRGQAPRHLGRSDRLSHGFRRADGAHVPQVARQCVPPSRRSTPAPPEFVSSTPYHYKTYDPVETRSRPASRKAS